MTGIRPHPLQAILPAMQPIVCFRSANGYRFQADRITNLMTATHIPQWVRTKRYGGPKQRQTSWKLERRTDDSAPESRALDALLAKSAG